jgi:hypothetical protein
MRVPFRPHHLPLECKTDTDEQLLPPNAQEKGKGLKAYNKKVSVNSGSIMNFHLFHFKSVDFFL